MFDQCICPARPAVEETHIWTGAEGWATPLRAQKPLWRHRAAAIAQRTRFDTEVDRCCLVVAVALVVNAATEVAEGVEIRTIVQI